MEWTVCQKCSATNGLSLEIVFVALTSKLWLVVVAEASVDGVVIAVDLSSAACHVVWKQTDDIVHIMDKSQCLHINAW